MKQLTEAEDAALEKLMPMFTSDQSPIHPYRVAYEINEFLTDDTIYIGDGGDVVTISAQAVRPRAPGNWMDPAPSGRSASAPASRWRPGSRIRRRKCCATTAMAPSA